MMLAFDALMRRFTIRLRMWGAIGVVLCCLGIVGGVGLVGMFRVEGLARDFRELAFTDMARAAELSRHFGNLRRAEQQMVIHYEFPKEIERYRKAWDESLRLARELLVTMGGERPAGMVATLADELTVYEKEARHIQRGIDEAAYDTATAIDRASGRVHASAERVDTILAGLREHGQEQSRESAAHAAASGRQVLVAFCAALGIAMFVVVSLTLLNMRSICRPLEDARRLTERIAGGTLDTPVDRRGADEIAALMAALGAMQEQLSRMVSDIRGTARHIESASNEVAAGNSDLSTRTEQNAANIQQTASSMEQLTGTVKQTAESARTANQLASSAQTTAAKGGEVVAQVVTTMDEINASSKKIADIISVIDGIAFQTNILALNAAVEAARAGEQGRGFAVVAGEVRSLAQRSAQAAKEIKDLIGASVEKVESGSKLVADAGQTMSEIVASVQRVSDIINEITAAAAEQSEGIGQVNHAVNSLDQMTQQNAALVEQSAAAAASLKDQAAHLAASVSVFKTAAA